MIYNTSETQASLNLVFENSFTPERAEQIDEDRLREIRTSTLILWADRNPGTGPDGGLRLSQIIAGSECYCIKDAAHWPQWERAEEHDRVVTQFLLKPQVLFGGRRLVRHREPWREVIAEVPNSISSRQAA